MAPSGAVSQLNTAQQNSITLYVHKNQFLFFLQEQHPLHLFVFMESLQPGAFSQLFQEIHCDYQKSLSAAGTQQILWSLGALHLLKRPFSILALS